MAGKKTGGKRPGQKYKSLLVWQILQKETDSRHPITVERIQEYLQAYGIETDVRSIYRDIHDLQELFDKDNDVDDFIVDDREHLGYEIGYTRKPIGDSGDFEKSSGYMVTQRPYDFEDIRLLAECINSTRFISNSQAHMLREMLGTFCSKYEEERLLDEIDNVNRPKTPNREMMHSVPEINEAIKQNKKIKFQYNRYTLENRTSQTIRKRGVVTASPFQVMITEGNYYAFCYDNRMHRIIPYRIDRMTKVEIINEPREGYDKFAAIDIQTFPQRVFGMFQGKEYVVEMRFENKMLDTVVDRLGAGTKGSSVRYEPSGDSHFKVTAPIQISDQFFGWFAGNRGKAEILSPEIVREQYKEFIADIAAMYE